MAVNMYLLVFLATSLMSTAFGTCPPEEFVWPCTCSKNFLRCGVVSEVELVRVFNALKNHPGGTDLLYFNFDNLDVPYFPSGLFDGFRLSTLYVNTSALKSFAYPKSNQSIFLGNEDTFRSLTFHYHTNLIDDFDWSSLAPAKRLYNLYLKGTFSAIRTPFPYLPEVVNFSLEESNVTYIVDKAFAGLISVDYLKVINNKVDIYNRGIYPRPAPSLRVFITIGDSILKLPEDYFEDMPSLRYAQIPAFVESIPRLYANGTVGLQSSRGLTCDCRLNWLLRMRDEGKVIIYHAICARPERLYWKDVDTLTEEELCG